MKLDEEELKKECKEQKEIFNLLITSMLENKASNEILVLREIEALRLERYSAIRESKS